MTEALARRTDPETSHAAAAVVDVNKLERMIIRKLASVHAAGMTCSELAFHTSTPRDSISPRMKGLVEKNLIETRGEPEERRVPIVPADGRRKPKQLIWFLTENGRVISSGLPQSEPL